MLAMDPWTGTKASTLSAAIKEVEAVRGPALYPDLGSTLPWSKASRVVSQLFAPGELRQSPASTYTYWISRYLPGTGRNKVMSSNS